MRQVVMMDDLREFELWPSKLFDQYLKITEQEVKRLLLDSGKLVDVSCPGCNSNRKKKAFKKYGLDYVECADCRTLYLSPRPSDDQIKRYHNESKSVEFWNSSIIKETLKSRSVHQSKPRATWIANLTEEYFKDPKVFVEFNPISPGFLQEVDNLNLFKTKILFDPYIKTLKSFKEKNSFKIVGSTEKYDEINANAVSALGVIDRVFSPERFLNMAKSLLLDGGLLFLTTSTISGFDLQVLWDNSKNIFPPDRINLLSIEGLTALFEKTGFEIIELSTPGQLDVELVKNAINKNKNIELTRFISYLMHSRDEDTHRSFQEFLQRNNLSSHVRIAARKK